MKRYGILLPLLLLCSVCLSLFADSDADKAKSRYYLIQGLQNAAQFKMPEAYELLNKAYTLNPEEKYAGYMTGLLDVALGDSAKASDGARRAREYVDAYPDSYQEILTYVDMCDNMDDKEEAQRVLRRLLRFYPQDDRLIFSLAQLALMLGQNDSAIRYLNKYEELNGYNSRITEVKMAAHFMKGDSTAALNEIDRALAANPANPKFYTIKSEFLGSIGMMDSAYRCLKSADSLFPGNWDVKCSLAGYYETIGDSVTQRKMIFDAMESEDVDIEDKLKLCMSYVMPRLMDGKNTEHSDEMLETLQNQYPYDPYLRDVLAGYYAYKGNMDKAIDQMKISVDMEPDNPDYNARLLQYMVGDGRYQEAVDFYRNIPAEITEESVPMAVMACGAYQGLEEFPEALALIDTMLCRITKGIAPEDLTMKHINATFSGYGQEVLADMLSERGNILYQMNRPNEADSTYALAIALKPTDALFLNNYAYFIAKKGGDLEKAYDMILKSLEKEPDNPLILDTYAYILFRQGKYTEALESIKKAIDNVADPEDLSSDYYEHYGDILFKSGKPDEAVEMWKEALRLDPSLEIVKKKIKTKSYIDE